MQLLICAYYTQMPKSTSTALFTIVLSWHPPGPTKILQVKSFTTHSHAKIPSWWIRLSLKRKTAAVYGKADMHMQQRVAQHKHLHDKMLHFDPMFALNQSVFLDKSPSTNRRNTPKEMATNNFIKLHPRKTGPFEIIKAQTLTVAINKEGPL